MNLLYPFGYARRFREVIREIRGKSVVEYCFGDIIIARHCIKNDLQWTGYDISRNFVNFARKRGFDARIADVSLMDAPVADCCIIAGSLYHFLPDPEPVISAMMRHSRRLIISEPVSNLSSGKGLTARIAAYLSRTPAGIHRERFDETGLEDTLRKVAVKNNFEISSIKRYKKDVIIVLDHA
jgi:SAM-dependent methyltransferase